MKGRPKQNRVPERKVYFLRSAAGSQQATDKSYNMDMPSDVNSDTLSTESWEENNTQTGTGTDEEDGATSEGKGKHENNTQSVVEEGTNYDSGDDDTMAQKREEKNSGKPKRPVKKKKTDITKKFRDHAIGSSDQMKNTVRLNDEGRIPPQNLVESARIPNSNEGIAKEIGPKESHAEVERSIKEWLIVLAIILLVIAVYCNSHCSSVATDDEHSTCHVRPRSYRLGNLSAQLDSVRDKYPTLDDTFWDVIGGSSWSHIQGSRQPDRPVVLLLAGQPEEISKINKVAKDVANIYARVFTSWSLVIHIKGTVQETKEMGVAKLDMDNLLKAGLNIKCQNVALITDFDKLPPCSVMLFHNYCDHKNAPYKDVVIIFTIVLQERVPIDAGTEDIENAVQNHLTKVWEQCPDELSEDKIMAIHSRVANNIAFVR